jgi:hypothetical protein
VGEEYRSWHSPLWSFLHSPVSNIYHIRISEFSLSNIMACDHIYFITFRFFSKLLLLLLSLLLLLFLLLLLLPWTTLDD